MNSSENLQFSLDGTSLSLLNEAIASNQIKIEDSVDVNNVKTLLYENSSESTTVNVHTKREHENDSDSVTAPKRVGRKPLDKDEPIESLQDPKQKRKAQNRAAQRAFRDRKEKHVSDLQARIEALESLNAKKDEELIKENERLKKMLEKLKEENLALKNAQFTFEFPITDAIAANNSINNIPYQPKTGNSFSEDASSSSDQSSLSNSHFQEDDSNSSDTNPIFSVDPLQFGLLDTSHLDFLNNEFNNDSIGTETLPAADLFHGKDDLFTQYGVPTSNTVDDFLFMNQDNSLFAANNDLFEFSDISTSFPAPVTTEDKKEFLVEKLKQAQKEGKHVYQGYQEIKQTCPDFDLDALCDDLKRKAQCSMQKYPITDYEVNAFIKCLEKKTA